MKRRASPTPQEEGDIDSRERLMNPSKLLRTENDEQEESSQTSKESKAAEDQFQKWSNLIEEFTRNCQESPQEAKVKREIVDEVLLVIKTIYRGAELVAFGSSCTGMSLHQSDLDLSLTTGTTHDSVKNSTGYPLSRRREALWTLPGIFRLFLHKPGYLDKEFVKAFVPIIKFTRRGIHCDISLDNFDGIRNSRLLTAYGILDRRVIQLVLFAKQWAKHYRINDARTGSLSSYTISLMIISYLQCGCSPPVVPSLQVTKQEQFYRPENLSVGDLETLVGDYKSPNKQLVGELFGGFIEYYAHKFDYRNTVASVRLGKVLRRNQVKIEYPSHILVEEPYNGTNVAKNVREVYEFEIVHDSFKKTSQLLKAGNIEHILPS